MPLLNFTALARVFSIQGAFLGPRPSITPLSSQISTFTPYTYFASAAYCPPAATISWSCGANCRATPDFIPVASGGDGADAIATDVDVFPKKLNTALFPGVPSSVQVHSGFANEQAKTATQVLSAVKSALSTYGASKVSVVGHSLGAAIALLDSVYLPLHLPGVTFTTVGYGMPRWKDPVPIVPGRLLGYRHPAGEVHITESGSWESCPGHDNPSTLCIVGDVPSMLEAHVNDHFGPYNGINIGC
ncbi:Alpha/Beta hydrolase protein [Amanita rubescens]|nr:Alpha/Beta hydrolase protein [Amanita rubescens]